MPCRHWGALSGKTACRFGGVRRRLRAWLRSPIAGIVFRRSVALRHCATASDRKIRSVDRETRWLWRLKVLWTAACTLRKRSPMPLI
jgi:hypothetical protein